MDVQGWSLIFPFISQTPYSNLVPRNLDFFFNVIDYYNSSSSLIQLGSSIYSSWAWLPRLKPTEAAPPNPLPDDPNSWEQALHVRNWQHQMLRGKILRVCNLVELQPFSHEWQVIPPLNMNTTWEHHTALTPVLVVLPRVQARRTGRSPLKLQFINVSTGLTPTRQRRELMAFSGELLQLS